MIRKSAQSAHKLWIVKLILWRHKPWAQIHTSASIFSSNSVFDLYGWPRGHFLRLFWTTLIDIHKEEHFVEMVQIHSEPWIQNRGVVTYRDLGTGPHQLLEDSPHLNPIKWRRLLRVHHEGLYPPEFLIFLRPWYSYTKTQVENDVRQMTTVRPI